MWVCGVIGFINHASTSSGSVITWYVHASRLAPDTFGFIHTRTHSTCTALNSPGTAPWESWETRMIFPRSDFPKVDSRNTSSSTELSQGAHAKLSQGRHVFSLGRLVFSQGRLTFFWGWETLLQGRQTLFQRRKTFFQSQKHFPKVNTYFFEINWLFLSSKFSQGALAVFSRSKNPSQGPKFDPGLPKVSR